MSTSEFSYYNKEKGQLRPECKACSKEYRMKKHNTTRVCIKCKKSLGPEHYHFGQSKCIKCKKEDRPTYKRKVSKYTLPEYQYDTTITRCPVCGRFWGRDRVIFRSDKTTPHRCLECNSKIKKIHRESEAYKLWYERTREQRNEYNRNFYNDDPEKRLRLKRESYIRNRDKVRAKGNQRQALRRAKKRSTAKHSNANETSIQYMYNLSEVLTLLYNAKYHVDHIIPLSKDGIHHEDNLQIVLGTDNLSKGNRTDTTVSGIRWCDIQNNKEHFDRILRILY